MIERGEVVARGWGEKGVNEVSDLLQWEGMEMATQIAESEPPNRRWTT